MENLKVTLGPVEKAGGSLRQQKKEQPPENRVKFRDLPDTISVRWSLGGTKFDWLPEKLSAKRVISYVLEKT